MKDHTTLIVRLLQHQDYLQITLLAPPAVMLSVVYRRHKEVTMNVDQLRVKKDYSQYYIFIKLIFLSQAKNEKAAVFTGSHC